MKLGTCYFPEHWPEEMWAADAQCMVDCGLSLVRIGEFAWSRIEPQPDQFNWGWLDRAIDSLADAGLNIILCTPTATPPKWLVDRMPDMLAVDHQGNPRGFGSRRHYCFSNIGYRDESARITRALAERYGEHQAIVSWQTDNEYGCHDTVVSYSDAARDGFREWLAEKYDSIDALNEAWGNVFWSMEYRSFDEIDLPNLTVTEANPAHWLAFKRYSSDQVIAFNRVQTDILRELSPGRDIMHNAMGFFTEFDHFDLAEDLDVLAWDSYPIGFLEMFRFSEDEKLAYTRQGHPDIAAFHHDLYRGCANDGRWGVIEQQPGPVNWARHNPVPLPGMVKLWTIEAMAHGAEYVSYFRWRQFPKAQEQMHAGLLRPDSEAANGYEEAQAAARMIEQLGEIGEPEKRVALVFDYPSQWATQVQPQGEGLHALWAAFDYYSALRRMGLNVDVVSPLANLEDYALVVLPCLAIAPYGFAAKLDRLDVPIIIGARSGSKTANLSIPDSLPPDNLFPAKVTRVESLRPGVKSGGEGWAITRWYEELETQAEPELVAHDGKVACWRDANRRYVATWPEESLLKVVLNRAAQEARFETHALPHGVRLRESGEYRFAFNYAANSIDISKLDLGEPLLGEQKMPPASVTVFNR